LASHPATIIYIDGITSTIGSAGQIHSVVDAPLIVSGATRANPERLMNSGQMVVGVFHLKIIQVIGSSACRHGQTDDIALYAWTTYSLKRSKPNMH
jgi:hypothetical protein